MAHITNGSISYERRVKTGDFEHKHSAATIHFALDAGDDADAIISLAGSLAAKHVFATLRAKPGPASTDGSASSNGVVPVADPDPVVDVVPVNPLEEIIASPPVEVRYIPDVSGAPIAMVTPVTNLRAAKRAAKAARLGPVPEVPKDEVNDLYVDPTEVITPLLQSSDDPLAEVVPPSVVEMVEDFTAEAPGASDAELGQALSRVAAKLKDRPKIQALIGEFVQSGQSYTLIPAVRRGEFIKRLEILV